MAAARELEIADEPSACPAADHDRPERRRALRRARVHHAAVKDSNPIGAPRARSTIRKSSCSFDRDMSVRYDLRLKMLPAIAGEASFNRVERMLATPTAQRT